MRVRCTLLFRDIIIRYPQIYGGTNETDVFATLLVSWAPYVRDQYNFCNNSAILCTEVESPHFMPMEIEAWKFQWQDLVLESTLLVCQGVSRNWVPAIKCRTHDVKTNTGFRVASPLQGLPAPV